MKIISDLNIAIKKDGFYNKQFEAENFGEKNILFLNPQLSGKQMYKMFLPYFGMLNDTVKTALTGIGKYNPVEQLTDLDVKLSSSDVIWADFIVIPFTTENLTEGNNNLYDAIRNINNQCHIVYSIDFNFYELSDNHPYKSLFNSQAITNIENNIWNCDICMVSNMPFRDYLVDKMRDLASGRLSRKETNASISCMPFYIDTHIMLENVDFDVQTPVLSGSENKHSKETKDNMQNITDANNPKQIKVYFENEKWVLKKGKYIKPFEEYKTKVKAVTEAKKFIQKGFDIIIYKKDGTMETSKQLNQKLKK